MKFIVMVSVINFIQILSQKYDESYDVMKTVENVDIYFGQEIDDFHVLDRDDVLDMLLITFLNKELKEVSKIADKEKKKIKLSLDEQDQLSMLFMFQLFFDLRYPGVKMTKKKLRQILNEMEIQSFIQEQLSQHRKIRKNQVYNIEDDLDDADFQLTFLSYKYEKSYQFKLWFQIMQDQIFSLKIDGIFCKVGLEDLKNLDSFACNFLKQNNLDICFKDKLVQRCRSFFEMFVGNEQEKNSKTQKKFYGNFNQEIFDDETEKQITQMNQNYYQTLKQSDRVFERLYKDSLRRKRKFQQIQKLKQKLEQSEIFIQKIQNKENLEENITSKQSQVIEKQPQKKSNRFDELYHDALNQQKRKQQKIEQSKFDTKKFTNKNSEKILQDSSIPRNFYHRVLYQKKMRQRSLKKIIKDTQHSFHPKTNKNTKNKSQDDIPRYQKLFMQSKKSKVISTQQHKRVMSHNSKSIVNIQVKALSNQYFQIFKDMFTETIKVDHIDLRSIQERKLQILTPLLLDMNQFNHDITKQQFECLFIQFYSQLNLFDKQILQNKTKLQKKLSEFLFTPKLNQKSLKMAKNRKFKNLFQSQKN